DYENARVRVIVGKVHVLDEIAALARRQFPYGRPGEADVADRLQLGRDLGEKRELERLESRLAAVTAARARPKEIVKEGLSEYFLYTIEGTETIPTGWSKRLQSFDVDGVPVVSLYKFEEERYGPSAIRFLSFTNDEEHELGQTPIPDGAIKVYRGVDDQKHLSYEGRSSFKYIPVGEEVELNLGPVQDVVVEPTLMETRTDNYRFDRDRDISGWDDIQTYKVEARNTRDVPARIEITRNFDTSAWELRRSGQIDAYEQVDLDSVKFTLDLASRSAKTFEYTVTLYRGVRENDLTARTR
ncbi:MAG: hypothetical protein JW993_12265, partial [Sedimentisphaerales bacterium]|nr:hypothetical protein [Sedimentisphaerales bacterium]